jgi:glycosyltransferase involved in cell wall biosynthesis
MSDRDVNVAAALTETRALRVLIIIHNQHGTGPFPKVLEHAQALAAGGAHVTLLCTSRTRRLRFRVSGDNPVIVEAPDLFRGRLRQGLDPWNALRRALWLRGRDFDVVHAIDCRPVVLLPSLLARRRSPIVLSWWDYFGGGGTARERSGALYAATLGNVEGFLELYGRKFADQATVISTYLRDLLRQTGYPAERTHLVRIGCDTTRYPEVDRDVARRDLQLPADATILCYVGALLPADMSLLLEALAIVNATADRPLLTVLVGTPDIPPEIAEAHGILLVPRQPLEVVTRYISATDLCLLPLRSSIANTARWPSKVADYFNAGRPVVATPASDFPQIFADHDLGYMAADDSAQSFAAALAHALADRDAWPRIGQACRRYAVDELDVHKLARDMTGVYLSAIASYATRTGADS